MGAEDCSFRIAGGNENHVRAKVKEKHERDCYECGNGGYTGSWAEWNGEVTFHKQVFKSETLAYEYLFGKHGKKTYTKGVVNKWEEAIAVQYRNEKGQLNWLVGACFSC